MPVYIQLAAGNGGRHIESGFLFNVKIYRLAPVYDFIARTDKYRQQLKMRCGSYSDFILALEMKIDIHKALLSEVERLAELTQRTNKCTNGVRFTVKNIKDLMNKTDSYIYSVFLSDKYADLGLIGAIGVIDDNLMLFNVSCRALGREVENNLFQFIKEKHVIERIMFKATGKNEYLKILISEFFPRIRIEE